MRVGVGGGRGFIGARVLRALVAAGHDAVGFGREGAPAGAFDALVWAGGGRVAEPAELDHAHVAAPLATLAHLRRGGRFVYLSSGEVYGPHAVPFREDAVPDPRSPYAQAKWRAELALEDVAAHLAIRLTVLRLAVVYGPGQGGAMLVPSLLTALRARQRMPMTPGEQTRDFVHVDDVAALVLATLADAAPTGLYNAGSGVETRVADLALALARLAYGDAGVPLVGLGDLPYRDSEQMRYLLDVARARRDLGYQPTVQLSEGLRRLAAQLSARWT